MHHQHEEIKASEHVGGKHLPKMDETFDRAINYESKFSVDFTYYTARGTLTYADNSMKSRAKSQDAKCGRPGTAIKNA